MINFKTSKLYFLFVILSCTSCYNKSPQKKEPATFEEGEFVSSVVTIKNGNASTTISTDTNKLKGILSFKRFPPVSIKFQYTFIDNSAAKDRITVPGPSDFSLEAVMYFDSTTFSRLMDCYKRADWNDPNYHKDEFNFNWLDQNIKSELLKSDTVPHGYVDLFWTEPNDKNCHIWMLNKKLLLHRFSN